MRTIMEEMQVMGNSTIFLQACRVTGVDEQLSSFGHWTVFLPTDEAFLRLGSGALTKLLKDRDRLTAILHHHIIPDKLPIREIINRKHLRSFLGDKIPIHVTDDIDIFLGHSRIVRTDIPCKNAYIQVIDRVLTFKPNHSASFIHKADIYHSN